MPQALHKCDCGGAVCELQFAQSHTLLTELYFPIAGSSFSHSWHNLHDCEYDSYCNGLDLHFPEFRTSLTCRDNQVLFIPQMFVLCAQKDTKTGLLFLASSCNILKTVSGKVSEVYIILFIKGHYLCIKNLTLTFLAR